MWGAVIIVTHVLSFNSVSQAHTFFFSFLNVNACVYIPFDLSSIHTHNTHYCIHICTLATPGYPNNLADTHLFRLTRVVMLVNHSKTNKGTNKRHFFFSFLFFFPFLLQRRLIRQRRSSWSPSNSKQLTINPDSHGRTPSGTIVTIYNELFKFTPNAPPPPPQHSVCFNELTW